MIHYFEEDIRFTYRGKRKSKSWINDAIRKEGYRTGTVNFIFCSDAYVYDLNVKHLEHDTLTDIITFDLSEKEGEITGDIFISVDRARENARLFHSTLGNEMRRLMIHGILHLCGYNDKTSSDTLVMRAKEDYYLSLHP